MAGEKKKTEDAAKSPGLTRRVQRTGSSSLSVTLPKSWTDSMNLETGDVLRFRDLGAGRLEISPANLEVPTDRQQRLLRIDASGTPPNLLARLLIGGYITGQDQVIVTSRSAITPEQLREIRRTADHVLGMTIVSHEPAAIEVQNFIDPGRFPLPRLLSQVVRLLRAEVEVCRSVLQGGDRATLDQLEVWEDEIDRFYLLMVRQLLLSSDDFRVAREIGVESHHYQMGYRLLAKVLELTADLLAGVGKELTANLSGLRKLKAPIREELVGLLEQFDSVLDRSMNAFATLSVVDANATLNDIDRSLPSDSAVGDALARQIPERQVAVAAQRIVSNLVMGLEMMVIVNETTINRSVEPETVAQTRREVQMHSGRAGGETPPSFPSVRRHTGLLEEHESPRHHDGSE
jgi:phosphate uptake regulator